MQLTNVHLAPVHTLLGEQMNLVQWTVERMSVNIGQIVSAFIGKWTNTLWRPKPVSVNGNFDVNCNLFVFIPLFELWCSAHIILGVRNWSCKYSILFIKSFSKCNGVFGQGIKHPTGMFICFWHLWQASLSLHLVKEESPTKLCIQKSRFAVGKIFHQLFHWTSHRWQKRNKILEAILVLQSFAFSKSKKMLPNVMWHWEESVTHNSNFHCLCTSIFWVTKYLFSDSCIVEQGTLVQPCHVSLHRNVVCETHSCIFCHSHRLEEEESLEKGHENNQPTTGEQKTTCKTPHFTAAFAKHHLSQHKKWFSVSANCWKCFQQLMRVHSFCTQNATVRVSAIRWKHLHQTHLQNCTMTICLNRGCHRILSPTRISKFAIEKGFFGRKIWPFQSKNDICKSSVHWNKHC